MLYKYLLKLMLNIGMTARRTKRANCLTAPNQTKTFNNNVFNGLKSL